MLIYIFIFFYTLYTHILRTFLHNYGKFPFRLAVIKVNTLRSLPAAAAAPVFTITEATPKYKFSSFYYYYMFFFQFPCFSSRFIRFSTWISFFLIYKFHEKVKCLEYLKLCRLFLLFFAFMSSSYSPSSSSAQHVQLGFYRFGVAALWTRNVKWKLSRVEYGELVIIIHKIFSEFGILMNGGVFWKEKDQTCFDKPNRAATLLVL